MVRLLEFVVVLAAAGLAGGVWAEDKDPVAFEGTWKFTTLIDDGKELPAEALKNLRLVLKGNAFKVLSGETLVGAGTFTVDAAKGALERTDTEGMTKGKTFKAIFKLEGKTMKVCWGAAGKDAPKDYSSPPGSGQEYEVLERISP